MMKLCWILIFALALNDNVNAVCIVTKDVTKIQEQYIDHSRGYRRVLVRNLDIGPIEYTCTFTNTAEINKYSQLNTNVENRIFIKDSNILSLKPNMYYWKNLTELHMENTNTSEIIPGFFSKFDNLTILEITDNRLEAVIDGVFSSLTALTSLNLSRNSITGLTSHSLSGLLHLKILDLSKNKITYISSEVFHNQNFLIHVDISQNLLVDVANIFNKTSLQTVQLYKNQLSKFDFEQLKYNSELKEVDVSENKIKSIKPMGNFTALNFSYNCLETINNTMLKSYIRILDLSNNKLTTISEKALESMINLEYLYLDHNNIKSISRESLKELKNLKHLELSFNNINEIQFGFFNNLNKLIYLDLSNNNMILDFYTLLTLQSLQVLKIQNSKIINFDASLLVTRFKNLNFVSLGENLWKCNELANTINLLQINHINVSPGNNTKTNNIVGISCKDNVDFKEDSIILNKNNQTISQETNKDMKLPVNRTNDDDNSENAAFYKFLVNISRQVQMQNVSTRVNNSDQNSFMQYLNQNFTHTNFYKYMEGLKHFENSTNGSFSQMINFFGKGFNQTNFYKYVNSLKFSTSNASNNVVAPVMTPTLNQTVWLLISLNKTFFNMSEYLKKMSSSLESVDNKFESQALIDGRFKYSKAFRDNLIFTNILLIFILCSILAHLYYTFWKPKNIIATTQEQVQLI